MSTRSAFVDRVRLATYDDRGTAIVIALLLTMLLALLGAGLLTLADTEAVIVAGYRHAQETSHGSEAALERALSDLAALPDWSAVLAAPPANATSSLDDGAASARLPDGRTVVLAALTADRQRDSDARAGPAVFGADSPQWRLYAHAPIADLLPGLVAPPVYLLVWVADDGRDGDGDPTRDVNGRIEVHAEALGGLGARRTIGASVRRTGIGVVSVDSWRRGP